MATTKTPPADSADRSASALVLLAFLGERVPRKALRSAIETVGIDGDGFGGKAYPTRLDAAVASVLLGKTSEDEEVAEVAAYAPKHLFTLDWTHDPSWPTAYYSTVVPEHAVVVITASADDELWGFTDFAIGRFPTTVDHVDGAKDVIIKHWRTRAADGAPRWAFLYPGGQVTKTSANQWADEVTWPETEEKEEEEEEEEGS